MNIIDYGNSLIEGDIRRLKKIRSMDEDLQTFFIAHTNLLNSFGKLSCEIVGAGTKDYIVCKERIRFSNPSTPPSNGGRLWFVVTKNGFYIRCLLYLAKEEKTYTKSVCFRIIKSNLERIIAK